MKQAFDLTLGIVSELVAVDGKVLLDHAVRMPLTGFDLGAQQSCKKCGFFGRGRKPGPSG
jgi:hypothetical protein